MNIMAAKLYHERQSRQLCALHVLNNLLQEKAFTKAQLDDICLQLTPSTWPWNPHRSPLGLGNYDVNVMIAALQLHDLTVVWFDQRKDIRSINPDVAYGFVLNLPNNSGMTSWLPTVIFSQKHWIAIRKFGEQDGLYFNLDSHLSEPDLIGNEQNLLDYLAAELAQGDRQLLIVVPNDKSDDELWKY